MNRRELNPHVFWPLAGIGLAVMGYGVYGLLENSDRTQPTQWVRWFLGAAIAHDFVVAPIVIGVGVVMSRLLRGPQRGPLQGALIASGILILTTYPFVRGYGRTASNPTILPNNYARGLLVVLGAVWIIAVVFLWARWRSGRPMPRAPRR